MDNILISINKMLIMINPSFLLTFIEVANRSSMVEAAKFLKITAAAVSKQIQHLESHLQIPLFKRSTRRLELSEEGLTYLKYAKEILLAYQKAEGALSYAKDEPAGLIKVICGPQVGYLYVLPKIQEFLDQFPKIQIQMDFTQIVPDVEKEKIDVVVGLSTAIPNHWIQKTLMRSRWVFCASPEYFKRKGVPKKPSDLMHHHIITHSSRQPDNLIRFENGESIFFNPILYFNDTRAMRRAALHGVGIVQLHEYIVEEDLKEKKLVKILEKFSEKENTIPIHLSYSQQSKCHLRIRKFIDFMVHIFSNKK